MEALLCSTILSLVATVPVSDFFISQTVDIIEKNHIYSDYGDLRFVQVIFWQWDDEKNRFQVVDWKQFKSEMKIEYYVNGKVSMTFSEDGSFRKIYARTYYETHYQWDPEMEERKILPLENRKRLKPIFRKFN
jgi:hypothetical protein